MLIDVFAGRQVVSEQVEDRYDRGTNFWAIHDIRVGTRKDERALESIESKVRSIAALAAKGLDKWIRWRLFRRSHGRSRAKSRTLNTFYDGFGGGGGLATMWRGGLERQRHNRYI